MSSNEPEKAQIHVEGADPLYQELRIENKLGDEDGNDVHLKAGAEVEVTIEAPEHSVTNDKPMDNSKNTNLLSPKTLENAIS